MQDSERQLGFPTGATDQPPAKAHSTLGVPMFADEQVQNYAWRDPASTELHKCRHELQQERGQLRTTVMAYLTKKTQEIVDDDE